MSKSELTKQKIIDTTIELIKESKGKISDITIRKIASKCNIGIGLINHYFKNKDLLIETCVQQIIVGVVMSFRPEVSLIKDKRERVKITVSKVYDFFMANPEISRISILGDLTNPLLNDNTSKSQIGFLNVLKENSQSLEDKLIIFILVSIMQESFLRREILKSQLNFDLDDKEERDKFIFKFIDIIIKE